jgi:hypothetical protein
MEGLYISIAAVLMTTPAATCTWMHRQLEQQWKLMVRKGLWINSLCRIGRCSKYVDLILLVMLVMLMMRGLTSSESFPLYNDSLSSKRPRSES